MIEKEVLQTKERKHGSQFVYLFTTMFVLSRENGTLSKT